MTPFETILNFFFRLKSPPSVSVANLKFLASTDLRNIRGSQNYKIGSRDPHMTPFDPILIFFSLELTAVRLRAKVEVSSFNLSRDIRGEEGPKIPKLGHVTPT